MVPIVRPTEAGKLSTDRPEERGLVLVPITVNIRAAA